MTVAAVALCTSFLVAQQTLGGITGEVTVVVDRVPDAISIPAQALFQKSGHTVAYVWEGSQFGEREVQVGRRNPDKVMIAKGLDAGEQVALKEPAGKE